MAQSLRDVLQEVLRRVKPSPEEEERVNRILSGVVSRLQEEVGRLDKDTEVLVEGSIAKGTWLSGEADADIFVRFPPSWSKDEMGSRLIEAVKGIFGQENCRLRFAEHPYVTVIRNGMNIDIVPCYRVEKGFFKSATDRTPFHTEFVKERLSPEMRDEARMLKRFFKGIGVYGAEIKTRGFSGFLVELLVYSLGGFVKTLEALRDFKPPLILDPGGLYKGEEGELIKRARDSLLCVIDPVDELRNVAAAVSGESLSIAQQAAYLMLRNPSIEFFYPSRSFSKKELKDTLRSIGLNMVSIKMPVWTKIPDILWGQAYRLLSRLSSFLEENDFKVLMERAWSDEEENMVMLLLLREVEKPSAVPHMGPPYFTSNVTRFIETYLRNERTLAQPFPRNGRWWVLLKPREKNADKTILKFLSSSECLKGLPRPLVEAASSSKVFLVEEVTEAVENPDYLQFLGRCIQPFWV
ncbi:MAG: CCA tRNA nucleotidyltransferase [Thermoproteota archaeon]